MALPFFAFSLFVSAFLLFLVQPMIGKMILPRLGGTPQVWNTCMVFFQAMLLAGYGYTHIISTRMKVRSQILLHGALLFLPIALFIMGTLYFQAPGVGIQTDPNQTGIRSFFYAAKETLNPIYGGNPILLTLMWLTLVVGLPFFVVATSAPLLQKWFGHTGHAAAEDPYFLYAASNIGSFASLLAYPFVIERIVTLNLQSWIWVAGYGALAALVIGCGLMVMKAPPSVRLKSDPDKTEPIPDPLPQETKPVEEKETTVKAGPPPKASTGTSFKKGSKQKKKKGKKGGGPAPVKEAERRPEKRDITKGAALVDDRARLREVTPLRRLRWIALTAIPSSLMLGMTAHISVDLSPIPLLWIVPLMAYLLTFVLVFSKWPVPWVGLPHRIMVIAQPFSVIMLVLSLAPGVFGHAQITMVIVWHLLAFFLTTLVLHGELAKDRPSTRYLTEFYLMMSVGGVLGGFFNAIVAPLVFKGIYEYTLAIFAGTLLRPVLMREGLAEWLINKVNDSKGAGRTIGANDDTAPAAPYFRDVAFALPVTILVAVLASVVAAPAIASRYATTEAREAAIQGAMLIAFGIPLFLTLFLMGRPVRYGLAIGSILLVMGFLGRDSDIVYQVRSYYGVIKVVRAGRRPNGYTTLMHGTTNHGQNYFKPTDPKEWGTKKDISRLATTYYHRRGPAGVIMEKFDWFKDYAKDQANTYTSDTRMPASLVGFGFNPLPLGNLPTGLLVDLWSEPPYATIGLGTGTMASYARPFQHMHYYEIDSHILRLSVPPRFLPEDKRAPTDSSLPHDLYVKYLQRSLDSRNATYFTYLADAKRRGAEVWVLMGDARLRMAQPYAWDEETMKNQWNNAYSVRVVNSPKCGGPERFYHMMVVDAFSSDAIPVHLLTKEAVEMYFTRLAEEGILCVHVSNRHLNLVPVVADIANSLGYAWQRGNDRMPDERTEDDLKNKGRTISTWVMVARKPEYFEAKQDGKVVWRMDAPEGYREDVDRHFAGKNVVIGPYWKVTTPHGQYLWTDDYSNLIGVFGKREED